MKVRKCIYIDEELIRYVEHLYPGISFSESLCRALISYQALQSSDVRSGSPGTIPKVEKEKYQQLELF